ncbi:MAG: hypothetical protein RSG58_05385 [Eubacterium sp.]
MKAKTILLGSAIIIATATTAFCGYIAKRAAQFENSLDQTDGSLDECAICSGRNKIINDVNMRDMKLGAFCGSINADLSNIKTDRKQYDLDIEVQSGFIGVTIPEIFQVDFTNHNCYGAVIDRTIHLNDADKILLSVNAKVNCGVIVFKNSLLNNVLE